MLSVYGCNSILISVCYAGLEYRIDRPPEQNQSSCKILILKTLF